MYYKLFKELQVITITTKSKKQRIKNSIKQKNSNYNYDQKNIYYKSHYYKKLDSKNLTRDKCTTSKKHTQIQIRERDRKY